MRDLQSLDKKANYRIQVQGAIPAHWSDYLGGLSIEVDREIIPPVSTLMGLVMDQAALLGILNNLYDLGFPLRSVVYQPNSLKEEA